MLRRRRSRMMMMPAVTEERGASERASERRDWDGIEARRTPREPSASHTTTTAVGRFRDERKTIAERSLAWSRGPCLPASQDRRPSGDLLRADARAGRTVAPRQGSARASGVPALRARASASFARGHRGRGEEEEEAGAPRAGRAPQDGARPRSRTPCVGARAREGARTPTGTGNARAPREFPDGRGGANAPARPDDTHPATTTGRDRPTPISFATSASADSAMA